MRVVCIVQARMGSTRLPGKVLLPLNGRTVIGEVLSRCKRIAGIDEVVCAIPQRDSDDVLDAEALRYCAVYRGPEKNVLARYHGAARMAGADVIMRITGDCPLLCPELCAAVLALHKDAEVDYTSNIDPRTFPQGLDCEVFSRRVLDLAHKWAGDDEREHVTTWMRRSGMVSKTSLVSRWPMDGRLCLDTDDDYRVICAAFEGANHGQRRHQGPGDQVATGRTASVAQGVP